MPFIVATYVYASSQGHALRSDQNDYDSSNYTHIVYRCKELFKAVKYRDLVRRKEQGEISQDLLNEMLIDVS